MPSLISIIVPVYNVENYLKRCVKSILGQTYKNLEIILINDGSIDNSGSICDEFFKTDKRVKVFHIKNGGSSIARNFGLKHAKGEYIGFVDSDDWVKPNMFEELLKYAKENRLKVVETSSTHSHLNDNKVSESIKAIIENKEEALKRIIKFKRFAVWRRFYHKSILKDRFFIEGVLHQDVYYTIDILNEIPKIGFFENEFYVYNIQNPKSVIRSDYSELKLRSINAGFYVVEKTKHYSKDINDEAIGYMSKFLTYHYNSLFLNKEFDKDGKFRKYIRKTLKEYKNNKKIGNYEKIIIALPPTFYKVFLILNNSRIKLQSKIYKLKNNV